MRSFRAENVSHLVKAILDREKAVAQETFRQIAGRYPITLTRDLHRAKQWVRHHARGTERYGLVASSKAQRLKPDAIDIHVDVDPVHWFLKDKDDTRSSYYLEDAATEFQVQGLELDWACVAWDGDLRFSEEGWNHHFFRGNRWCRIANAENQRYLRNAYRVLLTRADRGWLSMSRLGIRRITRADLRFMIRRTSISARSVFRCWPERSCFHARLKGDRRFGTQAAHGDSARRRTTEEFR